VVVAMLGALESGAAREAVRRLWEHPAGRVRATVIEAIGRRDPAEVSRRIVELKPEEHHRVRGNAAKAVLLAADGDEGASALLASMLGDERPLQRLAALWALERVAMIRGEALAAELVRRVAELARNEPEAPVRKRAERCAARLLAVVRSGWKSRAPEVGPSGEEA
jgi:HEAT repeat protein